MKTLKTYASYRFSRGSIGSTLALLLLALSGCQAFAPTSPIPETSSRQKKQIEKMAAQESFPSPADVGLDSLGQEKK